MRQRIRKLLRRLKPDLADLLIAAGAALLGVGLWWLSPAVSLIALGVLALAGGLAMLKIPRK